MKGLLFVLLSVGMKVWYERTREKVLPVDILHRIERDMLRESLRVHIRSRVD
jgi:hypothetical protein